MKKKKGILAVLKDAFSVPDESACPPPRRDPGWRNRKRESALRDAREGQKWQK